MEQSSCYSDFFFESAGELKDIGVDDNGHALVEFQAKENSFFNPNEITEFLGIAPKSTVTMGTVMKSGRKYPFSNWAACEQTEPRRDAEEQVLAIVRTLKPLIPKILAIKKKYNVRTGINITPHIYCEESPIIYFNQEIIEFCYLTGTEIGVDILVFDKEEE